MTTEELRAYYETLHSGDFTALGELLHDDVVFEFPGTRWGGRIEGKHRVLDFAKSNLSSFENGLRFTVSWAGVTDNRGIVQWTNSGRWKSGAEYANRGVTIFRFDGDLITEIVDYLDTEVIAKGLS